MVTPSRKPGRRKTDLSDETPVQILKKAKPLIRTDFGGADPLEVIRKRMAARGVVAGPKSCAAIKELLEEQAESDRKRIFPRIDAAIERLELLAGAGGDTPEEMS